MKKLAILAVASMVAFSPLCQFQASAAQVHKHKAVARAHAKIHQLKHKVQKLAKRAPASRHRGHKAA